MEREIVGRIDLAENEMCAVACEGLGPVEFLESRGVVLKADRRERVVPRFKAQEMRRYIGKLVTPVELGEEAADIAFVVATHESPAEKRVQYAARGEILALRRALLAGPASRGYVIDVVADAVLVVDPLFLLEPVGKDDDGKAIFTRRVVDLELGADRLRPADARIGLNCALAFLGCSLPRQTQ